MGKNKYIESPEKLWELFIAYKKEVKNNPRLIQDFVGKDGDEIIRKKERPLTIEGFKVFCYENAGDIQNYLFNRDNSYTEYATIITRIKDEIRGDQIEGGLLGEYNPNLTARINGIREQTETTSNHNINLMNIDPLADTIEPIQIESKEVKKLDNGETK